jgi:hypothetical protein
MLHRPDGKLRIFFLRAFYDRVWHILQESWLGFSRLFPTIHALLADPPQERRHVRDKREHDAGESDSVSRKLLSGARFPSRAN